MATRRGRHNERQRMPPPLIKRRIASGRGAMEQPNATHDTVALTPVFWLALVLTGVATGLLGDLLMWVLALFERVGFGYHSGSVEAAEAATSDGRRVLSLLAAGVIGAVGWYLIRRLLSRERSEIDDALWEGDGTLGLRRSFLTSILSEVVIGLGASVGREAAPKLMGGASGSAWAGWLKLTPAQKRLLVACGGGAGLAAVYNVPLGGALFTAEVLYGSFALPVVIPAITCSAIATLVGWIYLPETATYVDVPDYRFTGTLVAYSIVGGLVIGGLAVVYIRLIGWVSHHRARGPWLFVALPASCLLVALAGFAYPQLFGNGKDIAHAAFIGTGTATLFLALFALKPIMTSLTLGGGASGGVFTPFLATGAAFGAATGAAWSHLWPGSSVGAFALVGAAAMIGGAMQAPLAGLVLVLELTHSGFNVILPMILATGIATLVVRHVDGYSIYSARLPRRAPGVSDAT